MKTYKLVSQMHTFGRTVFAALAAMIVISAANAQTERSVRDDFTTQMNGSDQGAPLGGDAFGDKTDLYSGATTFLVTDVSLPASGSLPVALQRSLKASDDGMGATDRALPADFMTWSRYEVPYLTGIFKLNDGWKAANGPVTSSNLRCSLTGGAPEVTGSSGKESTWEGFEYWHGNQLYLPGGGSQMMQVAFPDDPNAPNDGAIYKWVTKDHWYFSCLPATKNGVAGEGFVARAPDGKKYYFDWVVKWRNIAPLWKTSLIGDPTVLSRSEYRILLTRVEDRFGNGWTTRTQVLTSLRSLPMTAGN